MMQESQCLILSYVLLSGCTDTEQDQGSAAGAGGALTGTSENAGSASGGADPSTAASSAQASSAGTEGNTAADSSSNGASVEAMAADNSGELSAGGTTAAEGTAGITTVAEDAANDAGAGPEGADSDPEQEPNDDAMSFLVTSRGMASGGDLGGLDGGGRPPSFSTTHRSGCAPSDDNYENGTVTQGGGRGSFYCFAE